jgi:hypothetical protein
MIQAAHQEALHPMRSSAIGGDRFTDFGNTSVHVWSSQSKDHFSVSLGLGAKG